MYFTGINIILYVWLTVCYANSISSSPSRGHSKIDKKISISFTNFIGTRACVNCGSQAMMHPSRFGTTWDCMW